MKLETFFENFDQFADAPDVVAKMRDLVLELAVSGKLVSQNPADDSASILLENLRNQRSALASRRKIKARTLEKVRAEDRPFDLPLSWRWARLGNVGYELGQKVPDKRFTYIDVGSIDSRRGCVGDHVQVLEAKDAPSRARKLVAQDTVIYSTIRPYLLNIAIIDHNLDPEPIASTAFGILHPFAGMDSRYLFYWLRSPLFTAYVEGEMKGMAYPAINDEKFYAGYVPVPPSAEQKRIVAKVEELMALCDRLEAQQKERETRYVALARAAIARFDEAPTPANLNFLFHPSYSVTPADLRKTVLNLAVRGKLVLQNPNDETAEMSLARLGLTPTAAIPDKNGQQDGQIPESWSLVRFEDVAVVTGGVTLGRKLGNRKTVTLPYLRVANVKRGEIDVDIMKEVTIAEDEIERYELRENDLLMTEGGDWDKVGRAAIWRGEISPCLHQNHIFRARTRSVEIEPFWFERYFNSPQGRSYFESASKQTTNLASINMRQVRGCPVPFPPLAEQRRILVKVGQLMGLVDQWEAQLTASEKTAKELLDAVVHELLHPTADVIEFPRSDSDRASQRAAIGCYAIEHLKRNPSFGHTMNMKVVYMAQAHIGLPLDLKFERQAAGPWHPWIEEFDAMGQSEGWFTVTQKSIGDGRTKYEYVPKAALKQKVAEAAAVLGEHRAEFDRLLGVFAGMKTVDAEIVATLFAAWNDFLIDGKTATDDEIIYEVRENWHESKERFTPALLQRWLDWMRRQRLTPQGHGPRTRQQLTFRLK